MKRRSRKCFISCLLSRFDDFSRSFTSHFSAFKFSFFIFTRGSLCERQKSLFNFEAILTTQFSGIRRRGFRMKFKFYACFMERFSFSAISSSLCKIRFRDLTFFSRVTDGGVDDIIYRVEIYEFRFQQTT